VPGACGIHNVRWTHIVTKDEYLNCITQIKNYIKTNVDNKTLAVWELEEWNRRANEVHLHDI